MVEFIAHIKKFGTKGEKTGWTYIEIPAPIAHQLKPGHRTHFRVKGRLDQLSIAGVAVIPIGNGLFIMAVNAGMRKILQKEKGASVVVKIEVDTDEILPSPELIECLKDDPVALANFNALPKSHQHYFTRWIDSAKTENTKAKRIAQTVNGLALGRNFSEVMREIKKQKEEFLK